MPAWSVPEARRQVSPCLRRHAVRQRPAPGIHSACLPFMRAHRIMMSWSRCHQNSFSEATPAQLGAHLQRDKHSVAHVQRASHVGRRHGDDERLAITTGAEKAGFLPPGSAAVNSGASGHAALCRRRHARCHAPAVESLLRREVVEVLCKLLGALARNGDVCACVRAVRSDNVVARPPPRRTRSTSAGGQSRHAHARPHVQRRRRLQAAARRKLRRAPAPGQQAGSSSRGSSRCPQRSAGEAAWRARRRKLRRKRCQHAGRHARAAQCQARPPAACQGAQRSSRRGRRAAGSSAELRRVHDTLKERAHAWLPYRILKSAGAPGLAHFFARALSSRAVQVHGGQAGTAHICGALAAPVPRTRVSVSALPRRAHAWPP